MNKMLQKSVLKIGDHSIVCETKDPAMSCYMSQQSIETAIKAVIVFENIPIPHIHNIRRLMDSVPDDWDIKRVRYEWDKISSWVVARYPSIEDIPTTRDVIYGIKAAQDILHMMVLSKIWSMVSQP